jgi:predicted Fe-S protein YdhL (DUF1289 family)
MGTWEKMLLLLSAACLCAGCTRIQDAVIRSMHLDHHYRSTILPKLYDGYRFKMEQREQLPTQPVFIAPDFADQG